MKKPLLGLLAAMSLSASSVQAQAISAAVSFTDNGAPTTIVAQFFTPIVQLNGTVNWTFTGFIQLTDATSNGVSASPPALKEFWELSAYNGTSFTLVGAVGGTATLNGEGTYNFDDSGVFDCDAIGACTGLLFVFQFQGSGDGDQTQGSGTFRLTPTQVPEPASPALLAVAVAGLVGVGVRGRRVAS